MSDIVYAYDVFISFAAIDQPLVTPIWQDLCASGLRVFWSDEALRNHVGASWFEIIQDSLERSRHMLLVCTDVALASEWVKREYVAFYSHCYRPPSRILVPVLAPGIETNRLPLFLRGIEACHIENPETARYLRQVFGGTDAETLRRELEARDSEIRLLQQKLSDSQAQISEHLKAVSTVRNNLASQQQQNAKLRSELEAKEAALTSASHATSEQRGELARRTAELKKVGDTVVSLQQQIASHRTTDRLQRQELAKRSDHVKELQDSIVLLREQLSRRGPSAEPTSQLILAKRHRQITNRFRLATVASILIAVSLAIWNMLHADSKLHSQEKSRQAPSVTAATIKQAETTTIMTGPQSANASQAHLPVSTSSVRTIVTSSDFDRVVSAKQPSLVVFCASRAYVCRYHLTQIEAVSKHYSDRSKTYLVDIDNLPTVAKQYNVEAVPVTMIFREGGYLAKHIGAFQKGELDKFAYAYLN